MKHQDFTAAEAFERVGPAHPADCSKEMGATPVEFVRQLRNIAPAGDLRIDEDRGRASIAHAGGMVTVRFEARPARNLGMLIVPVTAADIRFQNVTDGAARDFMTVWDRNFLRMGG